jgi:hypothetical protein
MSVKTSSPSSGVFTTNLHKWWTNSTQVSDGQWKHFRWRHMADNCQHHIHTPYSGPHHVQVPIYYVLQHHTACNGNTPTSPSGSSIEKGKAVPQHTYEGAGGEDVQLLLIHDLGMRGQRYAPAELSPGERTPGIHWTGGWMGPRADLDTEAKKKSLAPAGWSNLDRPGFQSVTSQYTDWATTASGSSIVLVQNTARN